MEVYFETSAIIVTLVLLGQVLELQARRQTSSAISGLLDLSPKTARRVRPDGSDEEIPLQEVKAGDRLRVRPGDGVPVDGTVEEGNSAVDEPMITGESIRVENTAGTKVIGGTVNQTGAFIMRAEKLGSETLLAQIVRMVAEAQRSRRCHHFACVEAPCICPPGARAKMPTCFCANPWSVGRRPRTERHMPQKVPQRKGEAIDAWVSE